MVNVPRRIILKPNLTTQDPNLMRSDMKNFLKSSKNPFTIHNKDNEMIVDAILRRSLCELFLRS